MCGILFTVSPDTPSPSHRDLISARGPDSTCTHTIQAASRTLSFTSSLLALRGPTPTLQPIVDTASSSVLCWNGEAWRIDSQPLPVGTNDTKLVHQILLEAVENGGDIPTALQRIDGEFAVVFYDGRRNAVWYGRDWAGRRSLVKKMRIIGGLTVASVGDDGDDWVEVDAGGWWKVDVVNGEEEWIESGSRWELTQTIAEGVLDESSPEIDELHQALGEAVRLRVQGIPEPPHSNNIGKIVEKPSKLAVLFSGGVDCTTIARLAHDHLPLSEPIDLLNVAFENPRVVAARRKEKNISDSADIDPYNLCPDRITGLSSYHELLSVCPGRSWRFISINIPYSDAISHRDKIISLIRPHNTEMDLSIAMAFYFASRGVGGLIRPSSTSNSGFAYSSYPYTTTSRILLSGLGADELFGGYTRHSAAYMSSGTGSYTKLIEELQLDLDRLPHRNLGRDDRVTTHWAKEMRYPFLDEEVVRWTSMTSVSKKCPFGMSSLGPSEGKEIGKSKMVLRLLASKLNMKQAAREKKRAVQFGARTAKMEIGRGGRGVKGTHKIMETVKI